MANAEAVAAAPQTTQDQASAADRPLADYVQAHYGRASKFANGKTRDWTLYFFFRILSQAETDLDVMRLQSLMDVLRAPHPGAEAPGEVKAAAAEVALAINTPASSAARRKLKATARRPYSSAAPDADDSSSATPSAAFRAHLGAVVNSDVGPLQTVRRATFEAVRKPAPVAEGSPVAAAIEPTNISAAELTARIDALVALVFDGRDSDLARQSVAEIAGIWKQLGLPDESAIPTKTWAALFFVLSTLSAAPEAAAAAFDHFAQSPAAAGVRALAGRLPGVCLYEILRQLRPSAAAADADAPAIVRSEATQKHLAPLLRKLNFDSCPINFAFNFAGLTALNIHPATLASFPDAFKQGMAARAERLGDTGPSAPETWDGPLGVNDIKNLASVHGYFTGGFLVGGDETPVREASWQALRDEIAAFNGRTEPKGKALRLFLKVLFRQFGVEVVHIELGEDPYEVDSHGNLQRSPYRREHFGFADGVSQPYVDLGLGHLGDPPPGGGTPAPGRSWAPVAPGEIYVSEPDEDGARQNVPANARLRKGATFAVFRKLEQRVPEFRAYLAEQRPDDSHAQIKLAAQFVGRWPNGAPLVLAPHHQLGFGQQPESVINNFLYAADDPKGQKCPLGAHARRTNPRDTGGSNEVRRHRILRRAISYGGPFLPPHSLGDGRKRGLLFVALNARIEEQFELIQSRWINSGEFLGQAGLNRCPMLGAHDGEPDDAFLEAGAVAPVTHLPRFVVTRGGDYFFAPGVDALKLITAGETFPPDAPQPFDDASMAAVQTPSLFNPLLDPLRVFEYSAAILAGQPPVIRVTPPVSIIKNDPAGAPVAFVGQYADVAKVLSTVAPNQPLVYSVAPYRAAARRMTRGYELIEGAEPGVGSATAPLHTRLHAILDAGWTRLTALPGPPLYARINALIKGSLDLTLRRAATRGSADMVTDVALPAVYAVMDQVFGIGGPDWVTELAISLPFYRQHVGELRPGWLDTNKTPPPPVPGALTLQAWSIPIVFDVVGNYMQAQELMGLSDQAAGEFLEYLDQLLATRRGKLLAGQPVAATLVDAFVLSEATFVGAGLAYETSEAYYWDVATLLMDLVASAVAFIPNVFGYLMQGVLDFGLDLRALIPILTAAPKFGAGAAKDGITRLIYETCRLNPPAAIVMRACVQDDTLPSGGVVRKDDFVAAVVAAAVMDPRVFPQPQTFSLAPFLPGAARDLDKYLMFGVVGGGRECWGRDRLALLTLTECVKAAGRLRNLRRAAGPEGALKTNLGTDVGIAMGLIAKFDGVFPDWPQAP